MAARCEECQTYGNRQNSLIEIAVDDNEGIFCCENCLADNEKYNNPPVVEFTRQTSTTPGRARLHFRSTR